MFQKNYWKRSFSRRNSALTQALVSPNNLAFWGETDGHIMSERRAVTVRDIKSGSSDDLLEIVDEATSNGVTVLQVLNRGRAI